ncbi:MAG: MarR family winged helix-turn-helix transcriptional regulator [Actinomycetota bacterium]
MEAATELWATGAQVSALCACSNLRRASRAVTQLYDEALKPAGLRATQFNLMISIHLWGKATIGDLAQVAQMDPTTLTRNLAGLDRLGLVEIAEGADRRSRVVGLSRKGVVALKRALPLWEKVQGALMKQVGEDYWRAMLPFLSNVTEAAQGLVEDTQVKAQLRAIKGGE